MSRHVPRKDRWEARGPAEFVSIDGSTVRFQKGAWWAEVAYSLSPAAPPPDQLQVWEAHLDRLGPFKRPRNAMVEAERHATMHRNRHGERVRFGILTAG